MEKVYVTYLGTFTIQKDDEIVIFKSSKNRIKKLIGLLALEPEKPLSDSDLFLKIWPREYYDIEENSLINLVYLARKSLKKLDPNIDFILRREGRYIWNPNVKIESDIKELENIARSLKDYSRDDELRLEEGRKGIELFNGEFGAVFEYASWTSHLNEFYNNAYFQISKSVSEILINRGEEQGLEEVLNIANRANKYETASDDFYIIIFRVLKLLNRRDSIINYFGNISKNYYDKVGEPIAGEIKKIYSWAIGNEELSFTDLETLTENLRERSKDRERRGAFYCEKEMFKNLLHFILRNSMRNSNEIVIMLVTIFEEETMGANEITQEMEKLEEVIRMCLRKDDIFSRYSTNRFLIMPFDCKATKVNVIDDRISAKFNEYNKNPNLSIDIINFTIEENGYQMLF
ncbi:MAG: hypothetical protein RR617_05260 [Anaerovoracaceae bacterium]